MENKEVLLKWRLILGKKSEEKNEEMNLDNLTSNNSQSSEKDGNKDCKGGKGSKKKSSKKKSSLTDKTENNKLGNDKETVKRLDQAITYVYNTSSEDRLSSTHGTKLNVPKWLDEINTLFPKETKVVMEKDFIKSSKIEEIINQPELFDKLEANTEILGAILAMKDVLPEALRKKAKELVEKVVKQLREKLKIGLKRSIIGALNRNMHTPIKSFKNIDWKQTITRNLKHYNPDLEKVILDQPRFYSREQKKNKWQIIIMIDESGSMTDSIIYSSVIASIFAELPSVKTNMIIFDTEVVDLSEKVGDPVDVLMSVTLGGGTDITKAVQYAQKLIKNPQKTLLLLISDFYEGGSDNMLMEELIHIKESGSKLIGIGALGSNAFPNYNMDCARKMNKLGFDVIACTPEQLAPIVSNIIEKG